VGVSSGISSEVHPDRLQDSSHVPVNQAVGELKRNIEGTARRSVSQRGKGGEVNTLAFESLPSHMRPPVVTKTDERSYLEIATCLVAFIEGTASCC
jgi:hypothetical protein